MGDTDNDIVKETQNAKARIVLPLDLTPPLPPHHIEVCAFVSKTSEV